MVQITPPASGAAGAAGAAGNMGAYSYVFRNNAGTYEVYDGQTGALDTDDVSFDVVFDALLTAAGKTNWSCRWLPGAYTVDAQMYMNGSGTKYENVTLDFGDAVLSLSADLANTPMFRLLGKTGAANHSHHITLRGGHFNVNSAAGAYKNAYGVNMKWVDYALIDRVHVYQARDDGAATDF